MLEEDNVLVVLANQGNVDALNKLINRYKKYISVWVKKYQYAEKYGIELEDLEQICVSALYNSLAKYDYESKHAKFKTYAKKVVKNRALTEIRHCRKFQGDYGYLYLDDLVYEDSEGKKINYEEVIPSETPDMTTSLVRDEEIEAIMSYILQDEVNSTILGLKLEGYSNKEISKQLDISIKEIYNRMYRIRKKLKGNKSD